VEKVPWKNAVGKMVRNYRATPHTTTGISPDFFMFNEDRFDKILTLRKECETSDIMEIAKANDARYKEKMRCYADKTRNSKQCNFKLDDPVTLKWDRSSKHQP